MITNAENTIFSIKRFMGRRYSEVLNEIKLVPYKVIDNGNDVRIEAGVSSTALRRLAPLFFRK